MRKGENIESISFILFWFPYKRFHQLTIICISLVRVEFSSERDFFFFYFVAE